MSPRASRRRVAASAQLAFDFGGSEGVALVAPESPSVLPPFVAVALPESERFVGSHAALDDEPSAGACVPPVSRRRSARAPSSRPPRALERLGGLFLRAMRRERLTRLRDFRVVWNRRLRSTLGRADFRAATVELNPQLLDRNPAELVPTLVHELCHLAAGVRAGHGPTWKALMRFCGEKPVACHRLDLSHLPPRLRIRRYVWRCRSCGHSYPRTRPDARRYRCGECGGGLRVFEIEPSAGEG